MCVIALRGRHGFCSSIFRAWKFRHTQVDGSSWTDLDFANDIALLGPAQRSIKGYTSAPTLEASMIGLQVSATKSKVIRVWCAAVNSYWSSAAGRGWSIYNLGSIVTPWVRSGLGKAMSVKRRLGSLWRTNSLTSKLNIRLLNSIVLPTALYSSETWKASVAISWGLNVFQLRCLRRILRISYRDHVTNEEVQQRAGTRPLADILTERRFYFAGHVLRQPPHRLLKTVVLWTPSQGKMKKGATSTNVATNFHRRPEGG